MPTGPTVNEDGLESLACLAHVVSVLGPQEYSESLGAPWPDTPLPCYLPACDLKHRQRRGSNAAHARARHVKEDDARIATWWARSACCE
jgi:hypothetical protein